LEIGQLSSQEGDAMTESGQYPDGTRSVESLRELRLMALLGDLIGEQGKTQAAETLASFESRRRKSPGKTQAAETLGVSPRTLTRYEESRRLTPTLAGALERHLLEGGGSAAATQRHQLGMLEDGLKELKRELRDGLAVLRKEVQAMDERQANALAQLQERVDALEKTGNATAAPDVGAKSAGNGQVSGPVPSGKPVGQRPLRTYYDLVTADAEPGEELVYGDAATAVIVQWREARDAYGQTRDALEKLNVRQRWLELEIELIEKHKLTLPPRTYPWDWGDRRQEVRWRNELLDDVIVDRKVIRLRRFLTFGL
jgi:transcriptional regulator with XRE-family HTH domain